MNKSNRIGMHRLVRKSLGMVFAYSILFYVMDLPSIYAGGPQEQGAETVDYARDIRPIFANHCYTCHGPADQESNYRLDAKSRALGVGDFGEPPIVPGQSAKSSLWRYVSGQDDDMIMPPEGHRRLSAEEIARLQQWIDAGAPWPDELAGDEDGNMSPDLWSLQPLVDPPLPDVFSEWPEFPRQNGIDHFISRGLRENHLVPSPPADRITLIRRIYLDMLGLYPTSDEVQAFVDDTSEGAYARLIDRVLASPHYGERWARHWLDVVRFGESTGFEVNQGRANAYHYRDYVIAALNDDKSYKDFVIEQLAGDGVGVDAATGFLVGGPNDIVKSPDINLTLMQRQDELADYVNTTSTAFLALTVGCARCHNHKFDPILQKDYYSMQAVFAGVQHGERKLYSDVDPQILTELERLRDELAKSQQEFTEFKQNLPSVRETADEMLASVNAKWNEDVFEPVKAKYVRFVINRTNQSEPCIDELEVFSPGDSTNWAAHSQGGVPTSSGDYQGNPIHQLPHINDGRYGNSYSWIASGTQGSWVQIELSQPRTVDRVVWARDREGVFSDRLAVDYSIEISLDGLAWSRVAGSERREPYSGTVGESDDALVARLTEPWRSEGLALLAAMQTLREQIAEHDKTIPVGYVGTFGKPEPIHLLYRGDPLAPREEVAPDVLSVLGTLDLAVDTDEFERRMALAKWITADSNPLTARVIVNRVWHYHFGRGIVATPSDFGRNGFKPSHPELLDWLAVRFMENGWSLKWLHREILSSSTYQQSSRPRSEALAQDADGRLLWRFPPRRLEAEAIRDCVLQLTGKLNLAAGGPGYLLFEIQRETVHHYFPLEEFGPDQFRRMIYMTKIRQEQDEVFGVFDCPDGGQVIPQRSRSTTALQSLNLLNSKFMIEQAGYLAERLRRQAGDEIGAQVHEAYALAFSRVPNRDEADEARQFVEQFGLEAFCRALLNANEFLFLS